MEMEGRKVRFGLVATVYVELLADVRNPTHSMPIILTS